MSCSVRPRRVRMSRLTIVVLVLGAFLFRANEAFGQLQERTRPVYKELYSFGMNGYLPRAGLVLDASGNAFGTSTDGGRYRAGSVYKLNKNNGASVLYSFTGKTDGGYPQAGLVLDSAGNLYGTTPYDGSGDCAGGEGCGVVFKVDANGVETVLHSFSGPDGMYPFAGLITDSAGNLYGTTQYGGDHGSGEVFELDSTGALKVLYSFTGLNDGAEPMASLLRDKNGNLYGTASTGGAFSCGCGTVFSVNPAGEETVLYTFTGPDGDEPISNLISDESGTLYGTTFYGGEIGFGTVFKLDQTGAETVLYSFSAGADGAYPGAGLVRDPIGALYGTAQAGGTNGNGVLFMLNTNGQETVLHSFAGRPDGSVPYGELTLCSRSTLCGVTEVGGTDDAGSVFSISR
jgi:uncharacterized repeat protein (TIGR03803 family)